MPVADIVARIAEIGFRTVLVTGGEPLLQSDVVSLSTALLADGRDVLLETSGTVGPANMIALSEVPAGVHRVVDLKPPASTIAPEDVDWTGIAGLGPADELKIVCANRGDYTWGRDLVRAGERLPAGVPVCFSPVHGELEPRDLAGWILDDRLDVEFQIQLHKAVWPDVARGV